MNMHKTLKGMRAGDPRRGAALMVSLVAVMVIAGLGAGLIQMQSAMNRRHAFSIDRRRALYVAEAGIAEAALAVGQGKSGIIATEAIPAAFGGGLFWVETADLPDDKIALICTARVGSAEFVLRTIVIPNLNPIGSLGFFGADAVEIGWGTVADGYHSGRGSFASQRDTSVVTGTTTGDHLSLGSNADIILDESLVGTTPGPLNPLGAEEIIEGSTPLGGTGGGESSTGEASTGSVTAGDGALWESAVMSSMSAPSESDPTAGSLPPPSGGSTAGDGSGETGSGSESTSPGGATAPAGTPTRLYGRLKPGPEGFVQSSGFSEIDGSIDPLRYPVVLPGVNIPVMPEMISGDVTITGLQTDIGTRTETQITGTLTIAPGGTLVINGPSMIDIGFLSMAAGATLELDDSNGPIQIYLRTGMSLAAGSTLQSMCPHETSRGTAILVGEASGDPNRVIIESGGEYHGILYAPSDEILLPAALRFFGSAAARVFRTERGARISYDRRLAIGGEGVPTLPKIMSWQIVPVGDGTARRLMLDPIVELRLRGVTPLAPAAASPETELELHYIDHSGSEQTYTGLFSGFNLADAQRVIGVRWEDTRDGAPRTWLRPAGDDPADAIEFDRLESRSVREAIRTVVGGVNVDVGTLTDAEVIDLITSLPNEVIATTDADVVRIDDRTGGGTSRDVTDVALTFDFNTWWEDATDKPADTTDAAPAGAMPTGP